MHVRTKLLIVRIFHTVVWAVFAGAILALPVFTFAKDLKVSLALICVVMAEVLILMANRFRCPLTDMAARYTEDRRANFDIYLPLWLAKYNKEVFGPLYAVGVAYTAWTWLWGGASP